MTTLLRQSPAVNTDCLSCGTTLLLPEVNGGLCGLCHAEIESDMKSEREQIEELTRQLDRLLAACRAALSDPCRHGGLSVTTEGMLSDAIAATGEPKGATAWTRGEPGACPDCLALPCVCNADSIPE